MDFSDPADCEQRMRTAVAMKGARQPAHYRSPGDGSGMIHKARKRITHLLMQARKEENAGRPIQARVCRQSARIVKYLWGE